MEVVSSGLQQPGLRLFPFHNANTQVELTLMPEMDNDEPENVKV